MTLADPILLPFLVLLVVYTAVEGWRYYRITGELRKQLHSATQAVSRGADVGRLSKLKYIAPAWRRYSRTFAGQDEAPEKTEEEAADYFHEDAVLRPALNLRYWKAVPNILVGVGILGTFVGLTFGISSFDTFSVDTVRTSIEELLGGMGTAFISSIAGMLASLAFNVFEKYRLGRVGQALHTLCGELDARFSMTEADRRRLQRRERRALLTELFAYKEDGEEILPAHVLRDLRLELREQTGTLKSFSTDLADGIMLSSMTIEAMGGKLEDVFAAAMKQQLRPTMEGVQQAVEELRDEKAASNDELVENVVDNLSQTLENIGGQFREALSGGAIDQLEGVAQTVGETGELLASFQSEFKTMTETLREELSKMAEKTGEEAQLATMSMREETEAATKAMREESEGAVQTLRQEMEKGVQNFGKEVGELQKMSASLLQRQHQNIEEVQSVLQQGGQVAKSLEGVADTLGETLQRLREVSDKLHRSAEAAKASGSTLQASADLLREQQGQWLEAEKDTLDRLEKTLSEARALSADYAQKFEVISGGLRAIFEELEQGLSDYQNTTRESINNYLQGFAKNLQTATNALSGTVAALDESFDDLLDVFDKAGVKLNRHNGAR